VQVSLGCHVDGVALPHCDPADPDTVEAGIRKRFLMSPPEPDPNKFARFKKFVKKWILKNVVPLDPHSDTRVEIWLTRTNYPEKRKKELLDCWYEANCHVSKRHHKVKSFMKDETYPEYKHARGINSRTDVFKCAVGPIFKLIEEQIFQHPAFIKKVPLNERPAYIKERLYRVGAKFFSGDFTAYESHFKKKIMEACEFQLYSHMVQHMPDGPEFMRLLREVVAGDNHCQYKWFDVFCEAKRMSGEMNTSLGNGFTNLMLILFLFSELGEEVSPVVEGDDSNTSFMNRCPSETDFLALGFTIKCKVYERFEEMSFCGMLFDPDDLINIADPAKVLCSFGWSGQKYVNYSAKKKRLLLRCKALSYAYQYTGSPIIQSFSHYILRCTRSLDVRGFIRTNKRFDSWERTRLEEAIAFHAKSPEHGYREVPWKTRMLTERLFGVTENCQREIEKHFDSLTRIEPVSGKILDYINIPHVYRDYFDRYAEVVTRGTDEVNFPNGAWAQMKNFKREW